VVGESVLENDGPDTTLARLLHRTARVEVSTLRRFLNAARRRRTSVRSDGPTLGALLVERGLLNPDDLQEHLAALAAAPAADWFDDPREAWLDPSPEDLLAPAPELRGDPGERVGEYVIDGTLGSGAMGTVFRVKHAQTGELFALKTITPGAVAPEHRARLLREAEATSRLDAHRNLVRVREVGEAGGRPFLVLDLVGGGTLADRLDHGPQSVEDAIRVGIDLARGLEHLHRRGVLHRDVKPSNVLFDHDGTAKLGDFGLCSFAGARSLTETGMIMGTPAYLSPEVARGEYATPAADIFALGVVLYATLAGRGPWGDTRPASCADLLNRPDPAPVRSLRPDVPAWLDQLLLRTLAREPAQRPTADELALALEARRDGPRGRGWRPSTLALAAAVGATAAIVAGLGPTRPSAPPPPTAPTVWGLARGQRVDVTLRVTTEDPLNQPKTEPARRYKLRLTAMEASDRRVEVSGRVLEVALRGVATAGPSERSPGEPLAGALQGAIGASFDLVLDPRTGRCLEARGVDQARQRVYARTSDLSARAALRLPELESDTSLLETLDLATHLLGDADGEAATWTLSRSPPRALGAVDAVDLRCDARLEGTTGDVAITWGGERTAEGVAGPTSRKVEGRALLRDGRLVQSRAEERWTGATPRFLAVDVEVQEPQEPAGR